MLPSLPEVTLMNLLLFAGCPAVIDVTHDNDNNAKQEGQGHEADQNKR